MEDSDRLPRKLAAILYADVAGYSRLTGEDEDATHRALSEYLDLISCAVGQYRGRVTHYAGDAVLAMFDAVIDSLSCAVHIQKELKNRNRDLPDERKVQFRIGVNLGDVIEDRGDIYGDGVNVAARLESLADAAGVCISGAVHDAIGMKLPFDYEWMGEQQVKNIANPVRVYRVSLGMPASGTDAESALPALSVPAKPSVAVLPLANMSGDAELEHMGDGIAEDVITSLSRIREFFVIARNSSFAYGSQATDVKRIGNELGVRYVLEGSIRRTGKQVRVTIQLVDTSDGHHLWAEKYDRELENVFELQDEIAGNIVASIQTQIYLYEGEENPDYRSVKPSIRELTSRGMRLMYGLRQDQVSEARQLIEQALCLDSESPEAHRLLAACRYHEAMLGYVSDWDSILNSAIEHARRSIELDEESEFAHWILGNLCLWGERDHDEAIAAFHRALEINPNFSLAHGSLGHALTFAGQAEEGIEEISHALRMNPRDPLNYFRYSAMGLGYFVAGRYGEAIEWAKKSVQRRSDWYMGQLVLAASYAMAGRPDEGRRHAEVGLARTPLKLREDMRRLPFKHQSDGNRFEKALRQASPG
jgi:TolB-like protein